LKKFSTDEEEIEKFVDSKKIGAMDLRTKNICDGLTHWARDWK